MDSITVAQYGSVRGPAGIAGVRYDRCGAIALGTVATDGFVRRALRDFALLEAFEQRPVDERARCMRWVHGAADAEDEEVRVSALLDCLFYGEPLPSGQTTSTPGV